MTSRDFRAIANVIASLNYVAFVDPHSIASELLRRDIATDFANYLATTNPRFDRERFIAAATGIPQTPGDRPRKRDYA